MSDEGLNVQHFGIEAINFYWPNIEKALDEFPAAWHGLTKAFIYRELIAGNYQLWGLGSTDFMHVLLFTSIDQHRNGLKTLRIHWIHGVDMWKFIPKSDHWLATIENLLGCHETVIETPRKGWLRMLKRLGFKQTAIVLKRVQSAQTIQ